MAEAQSVSQSKDTTRFIETYYVTGLVDPDDRNKLYEALSATGLPGLGESHPALSTALCTNRQVGIFGVSTAQVECSFEIPTDDADNPLLDTTGVVRFRSGLVSEETWRDKNGDFMSLTYNGNVSDFWPDDFYGGLGFYLNTRQIQQAEVMRPQWSFELTKRFAGGAGYAELISNAQTYIGKVNVANWVSPSITFLARTCLCTDIEVEVVNDGEYRGRYGFEYREETWDFTAFFKQWGRAPSNADIPPGNGVGVFEVYETADFSLLPVNLG